MLSTRDCNKVSLTIKTYGTKRGLATKIHSTLFDEEMVRKEQAAEGFSSENAYFIKGPMGKGLQLQPTGVHVVFTAGTGILVFLDLVA